MTPESVPPAPARRPLALRLLPPLLGLLFLGGGGALLWQRQQQRQQEAKQAVPVLPRRVAALGRVEPLDRVVKVSVPSSLSNDPVREILVKEGQQVTKGQPLAILDSADSLSKAVQESQASVQVAARKLTAQDSVIAKYRSQLAQADVELRRYSQLYSAGASSAEQVDRRRTIQSTTQADLEQAVSDKQTLNAELAEKTASLERNRSELAKATIRAPFSGTIFKINAYPGDRVGDSGLVEMGDSSHMGVIAEVYQTDRPEIAVGQRVVITADGFKGRQVEGKVVDIARQVSRQTVFSGEAGENLDRRVLEVKIGLGPEATAMASHLNYLQVNVLFDPLNAEQRRQRQLQQQRVLSEEQRRQEPVR